MLAGAFVAAALFGANAIAQTIAPSQNVSIYTSQSNANTYSNGPFVGNAGDGEISRLYEQFVLPSYTAGTVVTSATLNLHYDGPYNGATGPLDFYSTSNAWNGASITWLNQPGAVGGVITSFNLTTTGVVTIDLTASANAAYQNGGVFSFLVKSPNEGSRLNDWRYIRDESLTVNIAAVPEPASYAMLLLGIGLVGVWVRRRAA